MKGAPLTRPTDWSALSLSSDPTPGDPAVVREGGRKYKAVADSIKRIADNMRKLSAGTVQSQSVQALMESRDTVVEGVGKAENRYRQAGQALEDYAVVLDRVQVETAEALAKARSAVTDRDAAEAAAKRYDISAESAGTDDSLQEKYSRRAAEERSAAADARSTIAAQQTVVQQAVADRDAAARTAIDGINMATESDGLNDGWWENWGAKLTKILAKICEFVSMVTGILALLVCWIPVIGQAMAAVLMTISAVAGILAALGNILLAATGQISWKEALLSIGMAVLSCIGLGWFRGAFGALCRAVPLLGKGAASVSRAASAVAAGVKGTAAFQKLAQAYGRANSAVRTLVAKAVSKTPLNQFKQTFDVHMAILRRNLETRFGKSTTPVRFRETHGLDDAARAFLRDRAVPRGATREFRREFTEKYAGMPKQRDPALKAPKGGDPIYSRVEQIQTEHIVPFDDIIRMDGFDKLSEVHRLQVVREAENLMPLSQPANASRQATHYSDWTQVVSGRHAGATVPALYRHQMASLQNVLQDRMQFIIDDLVASMKTSRGG